jgi:hypothetical protein
MMFKEIELLGRRVTFCRLRTDPNTNKTEPHEGVGAVVGIFLAADQRAQIRVLDAADGKSTYNIDLPAINATEEGKQKYYEHVASIHRFSDTANSEIKELSVKANKQLEQMNADYLGPAISIQLADNENEPTTEATAQ